MHNTNLSRNRLRLFITGASGLLGSNLITAATKHHDVVACYRRNQLQFTGVENISLDLRDAQKVEDTIERIEPTVIVHLAAETNVDWCEKNPQEAYNANTLTTKHLARIAKKRGMRMVFMSTDSVFDGRDGGYSEEDDPNPVNVYASSKLESERITKTTVDNHLIIRGNIYGWNALPKSSLAEWMLGMLEADKIVPGYDDVIFSPLLVNTLANQILSLIELEAAGTIHLSSADSLSKYDFGIAIAKVFGFESGSVKRSSIKDSVLNARRPQNTSLVSDRLASEFKILTPTVQNDLLDFKNLRENGYWSNLKRTYKSHE
jgi:dTDP-4-dehydrorhamnose reductase